MNQEITATSLIGGGELIFAEKSEFSDIYQSLILTNASGTIWVAAGGIDSAGTGSIGNIDENWTCVTVTADSSDCEFILLSNSNNPNMVLVKDSNGNWITMRETNTLRVKTIKAEDFYQLKEEAKDVYIPIKVSYAIIDDSNFLGDIPMTVAVNGKATSMEYGYMGYEYSTGTSDSDIIMWIEFSENENEEYLYVTPVGTETIPMDTYNISLTIPAEYMSSRQKKNISFTLAQTMIEESLEFTEDVATDVEVHLNVLSAFSVKIPKTITLDGNTKVGTYKIFVKGDIGGNQAVIVKPEEEIVLTQFGKADGKAIIKQDKVEWKYGDINNLDYVNTEGIITASEISAGTWKSKLKFDILLDECH
jgi:hypothetical protein